MKKTIRFKTLGSTHDYAKKNAGKYPDGTVIVAGRQTAGRGRFDRKWHSPAGGLYFSVILEPRGLRPADTQLLTFAMALAVASAVENAAGISPALKWPNDVMVSVKRDDKIAAARQHSAAARRKYKKIAGILTECSISKNEVERVVISAGINVNNRIPVPLAGIAVSASGIAGRTLDGEKILDAVIENFEKSYSAFSLSRILKEYKKKSMLVGKKICFVSGTDEYCGTVKGFDDSGAIILALNDGSVKTFHGGEVTL